MDGDITTSEGYRRAVKAYKLARHFEELVRRRRPSAKPATVLSYAMQMAEDAWQVLARSVGINNPSAETIAAVVGILAARADEAA